jgi:hypothetical protein
MELVAEISDEIEENIPTAERITSLDSRLIIDSFNEQIEKLKRVCSIEDELEYAPSLVPEVINPHESDAASSEKD